MTREELMSLYAAVGVETRDVFDRINEKGSVTLKKGSEALAIFFAYDELFHLVLTTLIQKEDAMRRLADA